MNGLWSTSLFHPATLSLTQGFMCAHGLSHALNMYFCTFYQERSEAATSPDQSTANNHNNSVLISFHSPGEG